MPICPIPAPNPTDISNNNSFRLRKIVSLIANGALTNIENIANQNTTPAGESVDLKSLTKIYASPAPRPDANANKASGSTFPNSGETINDTPKKEIKTQIITEGDTFSLRIFPENIATNKGAVYCSETAWVIGIRCNE